VDLKALKAFRLSPLEHRYSEKDTILYALGVGYGDSPADPAQLRYVYEENLQAVPSLCNVLAHPGFWVRRPELGFDWIRLLHGEQAFEIDRPIPPKGAVRGEYEIVSVEDKGKDRGAVMHVVKRLFDVASGDRLASVTSVYMLRGDGGFGGFGTPPAPPDPLPDTAPDRTVDIAGLPQSALIYRLSGDLNPIHADPAAAAKAGFPRPILHGLCTMGIATRAVVASVADGEPDRLKALSVRFSKPVFPGETLRTEIFNTANGARFRARVVERDVIVLDRGSATIIG
jgi:acyl dehydratase